MFYVPISILPTWRKTIKVQNVKGVNDISEQGDTFCEQYTPIRQKTAVRVNRT